MTELVIIHFSRSEAALPPDGPHLAAPFSGVLNQQGQPLTHHKQVMIKG